MQSLQQYCAGNGRFDNVHGPSSGYLVAVGETIRAHRDAKTRQPRLGFGQDGSPTEVTEAMAPDMSASFDKSR